MPDRTPLLTHAELGTNIFDGFLVLVDDKVGHELMVT